MMAGLGDMFGASLATVNGQKPRNSDRITQTTNPLGQAYEAAAGVVKQGYNNAKAGLSDPSVLAGYVRKGFNIDAITKAADWRMAGLDAMTGSSDMPRDVQRSGVDAAMNLALNAPAQTVWHGSPHKFDKFDMSKIGTGEGAQAYGHGLYMAESPEVAKGYQKSTSYQEAVRQFRNELPDDADFSEIADIAKNGGVSPPMARVINELQNNDWLGYDYPAQAITGAFKHGKSHDMTPELQSAINEYGHIYKADIPDEAVSRFLDWDKPLSQQAPEVQQGILKSGLVGPKHQFANDELLAGDFIKGLRPDDQTLLYSQGGIPGIRYLDGGSRGQQAGTSNFVLFDDQLPRILEVNGQATGAKPWGAGEWQSAIANAFKGQP